MKRQFFTLFILLCMLAGFGFFILMNKDKHEVLDVISADKVVIDFNNDGLIDSDETVCVENSESFSMNPEAEFLKKYSQKYNLTEFDIINLGYLAREFAQKALLNSRVSVKFMGKEDSICKYSRIYLDGIDYSTILNNSGFGIKNSEVGNVDKFKANLEVSKKLNLVVLNHHSNKYHTLDCKYGNLAHDKIIIPLKQLPKGMKPCNFCHKTDKPVKSVIAASYIRNTKSPALKLYGGDIAIYKFDYTKVLKPNSYCSTDVCKMIVDSINGAKNSIDIAIYGYDNIPAITKALENAKNRGVMIRFVYDLDPNPLRNFYSDNDIIKKLADVSVSDIRSDENIKIMHNKFIILDNKKLITGSMNYSKSGLSGYDINDVIVINSAPIAFLYKNEFEQMLNGNFHSAKVKSGLPNKFVLGDSEVEVYFSPKDLCVNRLVELIDSAQNCIYIPTFLITQKDITKALIRAKRRNIDVRVIIDANSVYTKNSTHKILRSEGILLKVENYAGKLHSKTMIIDDEYLVLGSMNFSNSGNTKNDENLLVIKNSRFAGNYKEFFLYLWNIIPDKYLKTAPRAESFDSIGSCSDGVDNNFDGKVDFADVGCMNPNR